MVGMCFSGECEFLIDDCFLSYFSVLSIYIYWQVSSATLGGNGGDVLA